MAASTDGTPPDDMEECVSETKDNKNENVYEEKYEKYPYRLVGHQRIIRRSAIWA